MLWQLGFLTKLMCARVCVHVMDQINGVQMNEFMYGWMSRGMGRMDILIDEWIHECMDEWRDGWRDEWRGGRDDQCSKTAVHVLSSKAVVLKLWVMTPNQISCISDTCIKIHNISRAW